MNAKERYDKKMPILSFRVDVGTFKKVNKIVKERGKWQSDFNRQRFLIELLNAELNKLEQKNEN